MHAFPPSYACIVSDTSRHLRTGPSALSGHRSTSSCPFVSLHHSSSFLVEGLDLGQVPLKTFGPWLDSRDSSLIAHCSPDCLSLGDISQGCAEDIYHHHRCICC
ncbi:hypothetical protein EYC84_010415 [Monilinia fructicola]|uniref:Uncharacterized protein n=1 Tax=Monilinia fructicola TaxID=38448 RepID=A0A5M9JI41_MONFR|nr:hypothetical protein EYC84_010415 [Monilinia fructicola]